MASAYAKRRQSTADPQQSLASTVVPPVNASGAAAGAGANVPNAAAMLPAIPADSPASTVVSSGNMPLQPATAAADPPTATAAPHAVAEGQLHFRNESSREAGLEGMTISGDMTTMSELRHLHTVHPTVVHPSPWHEYSSNTLISNFAFGKSGCWNQT